MAGDPAAGDIIMELPPSWQMTKVGAWQNRLFNGSHFVQKENTLQGKA
jgi:hypothetical protein